MEFDREVGSTRCWKKLRPSFFRSVREGITIGSPRSAETDTGIFVTEPLSSYVPLFQRMSSSRPPLTRSTRFDAVDRNLPYLSLFVCWVPLYGRSRGIVKYPRDILSMMHPAFERDSFRRIVLDRYVFFYRLEKDESKNDRIVEILIRRGGNEFVSIRRSYARASPLSL